jgi:hypothetical protein
VVLAGSLLSVGEGQVVVVHARCFSQGCDASLVNHTAWDLWW